MQLTDQQFYEVKKKFLIQTRLLHEIDNNLH